MCIILFAKNQHPRYKFVLAANRDEFYERPTAIADFWQDAPEILAGRDLVHGGTWLGITKNGRFAAVTNYRDPNAPKGSRSRGKLVSDFLQSDEKVEDYLQNIAGIADEFTGFNLIAGSFSEDVEIGYFSNRSDGVKILDDGIYGLSNHLLDTAWQKVTSGKELLREILSAEEIETEKLFEILAVQKIADDKDLPNTGIGIERERVLSPIFIETPIYGTRCSTVLLFENSGKVVFAERTFEGDPQEWNEVSFSLTTDYTNGTN